MIIYLVGYMGCGKSTVGKRLAKELEYEFVDLDNFIETYEIRTIPEIFHAEGESGFRGLEKKYLHLVSNKTNLVVATGGGTPCFYDNMNFMNSSGITIYLKMDVKSLHYRLSNAKENRPLIKNLNSHDLLWYIAQQLEERRDYYESAEMVMNAFGFDTKKIKNLANSLSLL